MGNRGIYQHHSRGHVVEPKGFRMCLSFVSYGRPAPSAAPQLLASEARCSYLLLGPFWAFSDSFMVVLYVLLKNREPTSAFVSLSVGFRFLRPAHISTRGSLCPVRFARWSTRWSGRRRPRRRRSPSSLHGRPCRRAQERQALRMLGAPVGSRLS